MSKLIVFHRALVAVSTVGALGLMGASAGALAQTQTIKVDGSSTVFPITEAVAEEFQKFKKGAKVTVGISGTGGGFKKFCRGEIDISDASRPISKSEMAECQKAGVTYLEMPIAYDALSVVVNPKNTWLKDISIDDLKKIWEPSAQGKITRWNQVNPAWPDRQIKLFGAGADSGTFDYFTEAVMGKESQSRGDYTSSEDDNVIVQGVTGEKGGLGYFGFSYFEENQDSLKALEIDAGEGCIAPSVETAQDGTYKPLSRPLFVYAKKASFKRPEVEAFIKYLLDNETQIAESSQYVPLTDEQLTKAKSDYEAAIEEAKA